MFLAKQFCADCFSAVFVGFVLWNVLSNDKISKKVAEKMAYICTRVSD
ncbi:hypothetical protein CALK_0012 [Chitinivibrio alkaliphilus ACht1]|uniref:Uncharacterized protein n=1 Tax=Chitinivibrio alkaliphilus ACht1 TaxID=1313304 RepID=U7DB22_9BACT|nr:hypothetical protein CALK_0012 [Chitinivibrio alkaliphilus ACht1]